MTTGHRLVWALAGTCRPARPPHAGVREGRAEREFLPLAPAGHV